MLPTGCQNGSDMSFVGQEPGSGRLYGTGGIENRILDRSVRVVPYPESMLSKAGKVQQLNRTKLKSVSVM